MRCACPANRLRVPRHRAPFADGRPAVFLAQGKRLPFPSVSGAYDGLSRLPRRLLDDLEFRDHLIELADDLHDLAVKIHEAD